MRLCHTMPKRQGRNFLHSEGYVVFCPMLPGCNSQGGSMEEALDNIQIAIREWLIVAQEILLLGKPDIEFIEVAEDDNCGRAAAV